MSVPTKYSRLWPIKKTGNADNERAQVNKLFKEIILSTEASSDDTTIEWGNITGNITDQKDLEELFFSSITLEQTRVTNPLVQGPIDFEAIDTPASPEENILSLYALNQNGETRLQFLDSDGVEVDLAQDNNLVVRNTSGSTINKGQVVYTSSQTGKVPNVGLAQSDSSSTLPALGILSEDVSNNSYGKCIKVGLVESIDTSAWSVGDLLYVSATTAGGLTNTRPPHPHLNQQVGRVLVSGVGNGVVAVNVFDLDGNSLGTNESTYKIGDGLDTTKSLTFAADFDTSLEANPTADRTITLPDASGTVELEGHTHDTSEVVSGTFDDARIALSNVTQHGDGRYGQLSTVNSWSTDNTFQTGSLKIEGSFGGIGTLATNISTNRTWSFPNASGTVALTNHTHTLSDITDSGTAAAADTGTGSSNVPTVADMLAGDWDWTGMHEFIGTGGIRLSGPFPDARVLLDNTSASGNTWIVDSLDSGRLRLTGNGSGSVELDLFFGGGFQFNDNTNTKALDMDASGNCTFAKAFNVSGSGNKIHEIRSTDDGAVQLRFRTDSTNRRFLARDQDDNTQSQLEFGDAQVSVFGPTTSAGVKLGVGVQTPLEALDVNGNANVRGQIYQQFTTLAHTAISSLPDTLTIDSDRHIQTVEVTGGTPQALTLTIADENDGLSREIVLYVYNSSGASLALDYSAIYPTDSENVGDGSTRVIVMHYDGRRGYIKSSIEALGDRRP